MLSSFGTGAFSRAGAIAVVSGRAERRRRRLRRALPFALRLLLLAGGAVTIGLGASLTILTGLGPGPFDVLVTGIANTTGLPFAASLWTMASVLGVISAILGRRPGLGTVLGPLIIGSVINIVTTGVGALPVAPGDGVGWYLGLAVVHLFGVAVIGVGAGAMITSGLGAGTGDLLAAATSDRLGRSIPVVRTGLEISFVGLGLILGGTVGFGTALVAMSIGISVRLGVGGVEAAIGTLSRAVDSGSTADTPLARSLVLLRPER